MEQELGKFLIYQNEKGDTKVDVYFDDNDIWMTQKNLAELYQVRISTINEHIKNIIADGELNEESTIRNFRIVQNKMHYSIHGHTAAELIAERANASKPNMGLTSFKGAKVRKGDVDIAKNYLHKDEIDGLNRIVTMYLDYAEDQAKKHIPMHMSDWEEKLNAFLQFTGRDVLQNAGKVSAEVAKQLAYHQYEEFDAHRKTQEDDVQLLQDNVQSIKAVKRD
jgi:hypothetical protein